MPHPKNEDDCRCYSELMDIFGYVDPCPDKGQCNKKARKLRNAVARPIHRRIKAYRKGTIQEDAGGGAYYARPVYFYGGEWYT